MTSPCQKEKNNKIKNIKRAINQSFIKKYEKLSQKYNSNIIDNIIYNERTHIVALFKDRLITDDNGEFLKRYYQFDESVLRLPKFFEYYNLYSKIFPNYTSLPEGKYFYQNIQQKQKMIDIQEQIEFEKQQKRKNQNEHSKNNISKEYIINNNNKDNDNNFVFSTDVINSILNQTNMEFIELLFNFDKNNIEKEEGIFKEKINDIVNRINNYENYNKNKSKNKNNQEKKQNSSKKEKDNKNKSNSGKKNKINNTVLGNDLNNNKNVKLNYFNKSTFRKNTIFNLNNNKKTNNLIYLKNNKINKNNKNDKNYIKLIEQNIFKKKQLLLSKYNTKKNILHNVSSSNSIKKELSKSKKHSSNNSKKISGSTSSFNILRRNNSLHYKNNNKKIANINNKKLEIKMKNSIRSPKQFISRGAIKSSLNFSVDKNKLNKHKKNQTKYTYSFNNIYKSKIHKKRK